MARAVGKKPSRTTTQPTAQLKAPAAPSSQNPDLFQPIPRNLQPLVAKLPTDHVYAFHVDSNPSSLKRRVFVVPIILNLLIAAVLVWRVYYAIPVYIDQIITIFGYDTAWKVQPSQMSYMDLMSTVGGRTSLLMVDYAIFAVLGSWPWEFMFGSRYSRRTGPVGWRRKLGFRETEVVVRIGRKWDQTLLRVVDDTGSQKARTSAWNLDEDLSFKYKLEAAMRRSYTAKTGYLLLDKEWDLDFRAMIDVNVLIDKGVIKLEDIDHIVIMFWQNKWLVHQANDVAAESAKLATTAKGDASLRQFRDHLETLGAEDIFFRWIEIVQYESSLPGGFTEAKQAESLNDLRRQLTERGIDYATFIDDIGGQQNVPGLR